MARVTRPWHGVAPGPWGDLWDASSGGCGAGPGSSSPLPPRFSGDRPRHTCMNTGLLGLRGQARRLRDSWLRALPPWARFLKPPALAPGRDPASVYLPLFCTVYSPFTDVLNLSVHASICPSTGPPFTFPPIYPPIHPSFCVSVCRFVRPLSIHPCAHAAMNPPTHPPIPPSTTPPRSCPSIPSCYKCFPRASHDATSGLQWVGRDPKGTARYLPSQSQSWWQWTSPRAAPWTAGVRAAQGPRSRA